MEANRNILKDAGWQQFSIINPFEHKRFNILKFLIFNKLFKYSHIKLNSSDLLLVVTQTCDLVNDFEKEPFFEVIPMRMMNKEPDKNFSFGKNSRRFEFSYTVDEDRNSYFILPYERFVIKHDLLLKMTPYNAINDKDVRKNLLDWLTARFNRTAFPDVYDMRWKKNKEKIEKAIKKLEKINGIYIKLSTFEELSESQEYVVEIILSLSSIYFDDPLINAEYERLRHKLESEFTKCKGINVDSVDLMSSADISLELISSGYHRWDYSYLSYRDTNKHELPVTF